MALPPPAVVGRVWLSAPGLDIEFRKAIDLSLSDTYNGVQKGRKTIVDFGPISTFCLALTESDFSRLIRI